MSIYREDLIGDEREFYIESAICDNEVAKYRALAEMAHIKYEQMCRDAELKVLQESGTYDDLEYLYTEAEAAAGAEEQGFLQKAWAAICKFFAGIRDFFLGKGKEIPGDTEIEMPSNTMDVFSKIKDIMSSNNPVVVISKIAALATGAGFASLQLNKVYKKFKKSDADTIVNTIANFMGNKGQAIFNMIKTGAEKFNGLIEGTPVEKVINMIQDAIGALSKVVKAGVDKAASVFNRNKVNDPSVPKQIRNQRSRAEKVAAARDHLLNPHNNTNQKNLTRKDYGSGFTYRLANDGQTLLRTKQKYDDKGVNGWKALTPREVALLPSNLRTVFGFESADDDLVIDASQIREVLGDNYLVSVSETGDYVDITFVGDDISEDVLNVSLDDEEISIQESVFGSDPAEEGMISEAGLDYDDNELNELLSLLD